MAEDNENDGKKPRRSEDSDVSDKTVVAHDTFKLRMQEAGKAPPSLVLVVGPIESMGKQWYVDKGDLIIGRNPQCQVYVDDRSISKSHARVMQVGHQVMIVDLGSTNGTDIGGERLQPNAPRPLQNNDLIKVGNALFKFLEKGNIEAVSLQKTFDRTQLDPLTEIYNKAAFLAKADELFKRAVLTETPLSMIVFDIDNFKQVNDHHKGKHLAGDYVLKELASVIQNNLIRQNDFFARFGGEEFVLLLAGSPLKRAVEIAERIRTTIERHPFVYQDEPIKVTISLGVATLEASMTTHEQLFEKADQASYVSKRTGKNRVSTI
ncbi:MAG TPA: diguanylate cyclase [Bdellovibrionales bacterium]|nr:diguanylate cyclase [Bdellovibrionales bacterium]